jgi:pilus assembly protein Flp/PilA
MRRVLELLKDERAATAIAYGLIAAGIAVAIIPVVSGLGTKMKTTFESSLSNGQPVRRSMSCCPARAGFAAAAAAAAAVVAVAVAAVAARLARTAPAMPLGLRAQASCRQFRGTPLAALERAPAQLSPELQLLGAGSGRIERTSLDRYSILHARAHHIADMV